MLRIANGFHLDDMHLGLEEIQPIGVGKSYVTEPMTLKKYKIGYYVNSIFPSWSIEKWIEAGQPQAQQCLRNYSVELLKDLPMPENHEEFMKRLT